MNAVSNGCIFYFPKSPCHRSAKRISFFHFFIFSFQRSAKLKWMEAPLGISSASIIIVCSLELEHVLVVLARFEVRNLVRWHND